ncbi:tyrosine recombinase XerC [Clostridia bacterium]|nr:tyrosine recombinase XerC [Clostridia bacterium]
MDIAGASPLLRNFLTYLETAKGHSRLTINQYFVDLRMFFRFLKQYRGVVDMEFDSVPIDDVDAEFLRPVTLQEVYAFLEYLLREDPVHHNSPHTELGVGRATRARKIATLRTFFKYLTVNARLLDENPLQHLDSPKVPKQLPRYLQEDDCVKLLENVDGRHKIRDYCILTLFLNCGLRISELTGLNLFDIQGDTLRIHGKGNKERTVYLNDACVEAINNYLAIRAQIHAEGKDKSALFLSQRNTRIHTNRVHQLVKTHIQAGGLDPSRYSAHKLRHTAATLMLKNGVDVKVLQEILGHEHLNTTEIYAHVENSDLRTAVAANPLASLKQQS